MLYREDVRDEVKRLRGADREDLDLLRENLLNRRMDWCDRHRDELGINRDDILLSAYRLLLRKLEIAPEEAPVRNDRPK